MKNSSRRGKNLIITVFMHHFCMQEKRKEKLLTCDSVIHNLRVYNKEYLRETFYEMFVQGTIVIKIKETEKSSVNVTINKVII